MPAPDDIDLRQTEAMERQAEATERTADALERIALVAERRSKHELRQTGRTRR